MFDILKNMKYLRVILIIVGIVLALNVISFILAYWKLIAFGIIAYLGYKVYKLIVK
jgi:hypothetical protein